ncbi:MAG TPA: hypothetical protein VGC96_01850 [Candidatus Elarobacter sp.]
MIAFRRLLGDESGGTLVEYALVSALLAAAAAGGLSLIASQCAARLGATSAKLTALGTSGR